MKPHLTSATTRYTHHQDGAEAIAHPAGIDARNVRRAPAARAGAHLKLASAPVWRHKLILTGTLDDRTAVELEDEIECLCEEGVTILTLDLRQLDAVDSVGARTIAYRGAVCRRRGHDFTVIPGSPAAHHVLAEAGAESLLADDPGDTGLLYGSTNHSDRSHHSDRSPRDTSTAMIKHL